MCNEIDTLGVKKIIIGRDFKDMAYIECLHDLNLLKNVSVVFSPDNLPKDTKVCSINPKYKINLFKTLEEAFIFLEEDFFEVEQKKIEEKTIELILH